MPRAELGESLIQANPNDRGDFAFSDIRVRFSRWISNAIASHCPVNGLASTDIYDRKARYQYGAGSNKSEVYVFFRSFISVVIIRCQNAII